jgi:hypothetical protein
MTVSTRTPTFADVGNADSILNQARRSCRFDGGIIPAVRAATSKAQGHVVQDR